MLVLTLGVGAEVAYAAWVYTYAIERVGSELGGIRMHANLIRRCQLELPAPEFEFVCFG